MECELPAFSTVSEPVARKRHKCVECEAPILPGEKYTRISGKWDGEISTFRQHELCAKACEYIRDVINKDEPAYESCILFGGLKNEWCELRSGWMDADAEPLLTLGNMMDRITARERQHREERHENHN